ncbi:MAG TPA: pyridoxamine 5'-phosphate oxidase family protein [Solirubrobacterales bacterium]|nr:pyridoxamine 5'-phosphate oxidase family protein [Solirubrobacterales bacterium]
MAKVFERIDEHQRAWIGRQAMFFVGTAPLAEDGHVNVSPKGPIGTFAVFDDHTVAYLDMVGSGGETIAHLRENGRIVVMFCAFEGPPRIVRLHGRGEVIPAADERFEELFARGEFVVPSLDEARRAIIVVALDRISDSCGYGVPLMSYEGQRDHARLSAEKRLRTMGAEAMREHVATRNEASIDGLPVLGGGEPVGSEPA